MSDATARVVTPCLGVDKKNSDDEKTDDEGYDDDAISNNNNIPGFSQFLYFLFAPTLVYRDSYPQ
jgi:hypothetical protein